MAKVTRSVTSCAVNPLKMSQPVGGALAILGLRGAMPLLHGSQGCTSFGLVLFVRNFREAIPLQTTAMSEVSTVLGGYENVEQAILNIAARAKPEIIGILSTVAYGLIGVKYFVALGIFAGITELIPFIGPILGGTAAAIVALTDSWQKALIVVVFVIILDLVICALHGFFAGQPRVPRRGAARTIAARACET